MAKKATRTRYTPEQDNKIRTAVQKAKDQNLPWSEIHAIAKANGYKGGLESLKQRLGSKKAAKSHRVGNAKPLVTFVGNGRKAFGGNILGNGRKVFIAALNKLIDQQVAAEVSAFKAKFKSLLK